MGYCSARVPPSPRATLIALLCLSCASATPRPSEAEPRPACSTGVGAIDIPSPAPLAVPRDTREAYGIGGLVVETGVGTIHSTGPETPITVIPGQPLFQGAIERDDLRKAVRRHVHELSTCSASAAPDHRPIGGRIVVDFVIDAHGQVERSSIRSSTINDRGVDACVGQQACAWTFPAPKDGGSAVVSYPLVFTPR
jgi:TonB family protein